MSKKKLKIAARVLILISILLFIKFITTAPKSKTYKVVGDVNLKKPITKCVQVVGKTIGSTKGKDPLTPILKRRNKLLKNKYIIHACGSYTIKGKKYKYTNSKEALNNCVNRKVKFFEMDFKKSSDNKPVMVRLWRKLYYNNKPITAPLTYNQYLKSKVYNKFTTLKVSEVIAVLKKNKDMYLIADIKQDYLNMLKQLSKEIEGQGVSNRIIVQIYHENEYDQVKSIVDSKGNQVFKYMIYTLYRTTDEERKVSRLDKFLSEHPVIAVQVGNKFVDGKTDKGVRDKREDTYLRELLKMNTPIIINTINRKSYKQRYESFGVKLFTTDTFF